MFGDVFTFITQVTTEALSDHMKKLLKIPGSKLLFGGEPLENHAIPSIYGAFKPTAVYVPLEEILKDDNFELVTKEIFGPFQVCFICLLPPRVIWESWVGLGGGVG